MTKTQAVGEAPAKGHAEGGDEPRKVAGGKPPGAKPGAKGSAKDDLRSLPLAEVEKRLGSSPDGLSQAEATKRLTQYGPNEIEEKKTNQLLKLLSYFWGPIPWMIEVAVILSGVLGHWPDFFIILVLLLANAVVGFWEERSGRQGHRRPEGPAGGQGPGEARRQVDHPAGARAGAGRRHPPAPGRHRARRRPPAGRRPGRGGPVGPDRGVACPPRAGRATPCSPARSSARARSAPWSTPPARTPTSARRRSWSRTPQTVSHFQQAVLKIGKFLIILAPGHGGADHRRLDRPRRALPHHPAVRPGAHRGRDPRGHADGAVGDDGRRRAPAGQEEGHRQPAGGHRGAGRAWTCCARTRPAP